MKENILSTMIVKEKMMNKNPTAKNPNTKGVRVNTQYLKSPVKLQIDLSKFPKEVQSLDDNQEVYDRDVGPIMNGSLIELRKGKQFIKRFKARHPHIEDLSTTVPKKGKYSFYELVHLLIDNDMLFQKHVLKETPEKEEKEENKEVKRAPFSIMTMTQKTIIMYTKRILIMDRLLHTLDQFGIVEPGLRIAKILLHQNIELPEFYLNSFFNTNASGEQVNKDLSFIIKKINSKHQDYRTSLQNIYIALVSRILPNNLNELRLLEGTMNSFSLVKTNDMDFFIYFYKEYGLNFNLRNLICLTSEQQKQLNGYFIEIYILIRLILMNARIENTNLLLAVGRMDFIPKTTIINQSLEEFLASKTCSNTVFSNILKAFTKHTIHIVNFFYANCTDHLNLTLYPYLKEDISHIKVPKEQDPIISEIKVLVGETKEGDVILEDVDKPTS